MNAEQIGFALSQLGDHFSVFGEPNDNRDHRDRTELIPAEKPSVNEKRRFAVLCTEQGALDETGV